MIYPDKLIKIQDGLSLYIPDPELVKPTYEQLLIKDATTPFPFWAKIWPSAEAMSLFLEEEPHWIKDKRVLELGAGIGLPSFTIAQHAAELIISDHAVGAVELIKKNIQYLNLNHAKAMCLDWNHFQDDIKADILLLSDINYDQDQFASLLELVRKFLAQSTTIILATPQRITATPFVTALTPFIRHSVLQTIEHLGKPVDVSILILKENVIIGAILND